jgi:predicted transcriptional regulator
LTEQTTIIFRIEKDLKTAFEKIAQNSERTVSQYLRAFIKDQVRKSELQQAAIATESTKKTSAIGDTNEEGKTQPKPKKGQKLNRMPPRKTKND